MLDPSCFRQELKEIARLLKKRGFILDVAKIESLEERRKLLQTQLQQLQQTRNERSKQIGLAKVSGADVSSLLQEVSQLGDDFSATEKAFQAVADELQKIMEAVPNIPDASVPEGSSDADNQEISRWGVLPQFNFTAKDHVDIGAAKGWFDFDLATKMSGPRFVVMKGAAARLQRALTQFMLDMHTKQHGYQEMYMPYIVNSESLWGTSQLPKFSEDLFRIEGEGDHWLIPTAEVPLTNILRDAIVTIDQLPLKFTAHTPCFRSEVGSYGKDKRGMFRQHQFEKVELMVFAHPDDAERLHEELTSHAEAVLQALELPYRKMLLCGGDLGFHSVKTYDLEVWLPGQQQYREISSCSRFKDFQTRRLQARFRHPETGKTALLHTLNGSGLAVGRTLIALLENYQDKEGNVHIPKNLQPYMDNQCIL